ncbi:MAG: hypothetical protein GEU75_04480 [Dehalococcoidia bacterium]|nr:hypothetical protein [Dehalococcoidia bacterium]
MVQVRQAVPLLRVADVERSMAWYAEMLGFEASPFFEHPYVFAVLSNGHAEIMIKRGNGFRRGHLTADIWDVYLRLEGQRIREVYADLQAKGADIARTLMQMPYNDCEFDVRDPDGYVLCLSERLADPSGIPPMPHENET